MLVTLSNQIELVLIIETHYLPMSFIYFFTFILKSNFFLSSARFFEEKLYLNLICYNNKVTLKKHDFRIVTAETILDQLWKFYSLIFIIWLVQKNYVDAPMYCVFLYCEQMHINRVRSVLFWIALCFFN